MKTEEDVRWMIKQMQRILDNYHKDSPVGKKVDPLNRSIMALKWVLEESDQL